jgi:hypothetical protein
MDDRYRVGVTATRQGLTRDQLQYAEMWVAEPDVELRFGDCVGGDELLFRMAAEAGAYTIALPGLERPDLRAHCPADEIREPQPNIKRNHQIVNESMVLVAFPAQHQMQHRGSGTWATIRYAIQQRSRSLWVFYPDGGFDRYRGGELHRTYGE